MLFGAGGAVLNGAALPKWMAWVGIVLGILFFTPVGFFGFGLTGIWIIIAGVMMQPARRPRRPRSPFASARRLAGGAGLRSFVSMSRRRREREPIETVDYTDPEGNVLTLRQSLSPRTIRKVSKPHRKDAASAEDVWARRNEMLFEYLVTRWEILGLPLDDQKMLIGRYRMASSDEQRWVRETISSHIERHIPELS